MLEHEYQEKVTLQLIRNAIRDAGLDGLVRYENDYQFDLVGNGDVLVKCHTRQVNDILYNALYCHGGIDATDQDMDLLVKIWDIEDIQDQHIKGLCTECYEDLVDGICEYGHYQFKSHWKHLMEPLGV